MPPASGPAAASGSEGESLSDVGFRSALTEVVSARAAALAARDPAAWAATVADQSGPAAVAEMTAYSGLVALGVRDLVVGDSLPGPGHAGGASESGSGCLSGRWTGSVRLGYTIPGFDRGTRWVSRTVTLAQKDGRWRIQSWRGPADRWEPFDLPDLQVVRTDRSLVAGPVSVEVLRARLTDVELGQDQVAAVLSRAVPAVVIVPATVDQSARLLGAGVAMPSSAAVGAGEGVGQLAATTHGARDPASPALADRVVLDPVGLARLTAAGRRVVITHELTHVTVRASTLHDLPLWLSEGFAEWVAFRDERMDPRVVAARLLDRVRLSGPPTSLPTPADFAGGSGDPVTAYQASWLAAARIAAGAGEPGLVRLVHLMGGVVGEVSSSTPPVALDRALRLVLGSDEEQLVTDWRGDLVRLAGSG